MLIKKPFKKGFGFSAAPYYKASGGGGLGLQTSLTGFWSLENTSWTDDTASATTLTGTASPTTASGKVGNAVSLNGTTQFLSAASNANIENGGSSFSVQAWVNMTSVVPGTQTIFSKTNDAFGQREWGLGSKFTSSNVWSLTLFNTGSSQFDCNSTVTCTTGAWVHLVGTFNVSGGVCKIYVNGTDTTSGSPALTGTMNSSASAPLNVGRDGATIIGACLIDQAGFWKGRILSAGDVTALYNSGSGLSYAAML